MTTATLYNKLTGQEVDVKTSVNHSDCSYGQPVWIDDNGQAVCVVGQEEPFYELYNDYWDGKDDE